MGRSLSGWFVGSVLVSTFAMAVPEGAAAQDPSPVAEYRQSVMNGFRLYTGSIRAIMNGEVAYPQHIVAHATTIDQLATIAADVFPEGSGGEGSRALPEIWASPDAFRAELSGLQSAARRLLEAARSGEDAAVSEAMTEVSGTCRSCHQTFRARAN